MRHTLRVRTCLAVAAISALAACGGTSTPAAPVAITSPSAGAAQQPPAEAAAPAAPVPLDVRLAPVPVGAQNRMKIFQGLPAQAPDPAQLASAEVVQLAATGSQDLGPIASDRAGRSVYRFDKDTADPSQSNCDGDCATAWPPVLVKATGRIYVSGIDPALVGYVERADGTCQVTIAGWPAYYFAQDQQPGDVKGQGVQGTWFAFNPQGQKAGSAAAPAADGVESSGY